MVGVAESVAGAVDAGALAVPQREHAVVLALAAQLRLLAAPDRGRGEVLVEAGWNTMSLAVITFVGALKRAFERRDRRAAIAGDVAGRY